jgi:streptomycin 6-kinase
MLKKIINDSIVYFSAKWQLSNLKHLAQSSFTNNHIILAYSAHYRIDVVLKICPSDDITNEQKTLHYFNGNGCVKLLDYDVKYGGMLLEYIKPGTILKELFPKDEINTVEIVARVIKKLHFHQNQAVNLHEFPTITSWLEFLESYKGEKVPKNLLQKAKKLSDRLLATQGKLYLLHGDLHHENILRKRNSWVAIDPKGVVGELEYEVGAFIRNPVPELLQQKNPQDIIRHRVDYFSNSFGFEKQRLIEWAFVQSVLAGCWSESDYYVKFAQIIEKI